MRLTGGRARGRTLEVPERVGLRPTSGRVREALFSVVGQDLSGLRVLDAFGGSGLLGFEAWSRGADVVIVERDRFAAQHIRRAAERFGAAVEVILGDALVEASRRGPWDGVLADPPYADPVGPILEALGSAAAGWLVLEADVSTDVGQPPGQWVRHPPRRFGGTALHVWWRALHGSDGGG